MSPGDQSSRYEIHSMIHANARLSRTCIGNATFVVANNYFLFAYFVWAVCRLNPTVECYDDREAGGASQSVWSQNHDTQPKSTASENELL